MTTSDSATPEGTPGRHGRYADGAFDHAVSTERERLQLLESALDRYTTAKLADVGVDVGWNCLEVGAGAGSVARWMAERGARVTATDLDTTFLDHWDLPGLTVLQHDVRTDDFPPESFDLIHTRYMLCHLPDPDTAISRLVHWLAPGGILLLEEPAAFPVREAPHVAYRTVMRAFQDYMEEMVGVEADWARELPLPLHGKGLIDIDVEARIQVIRGGDDETKWLRLTLEQARPRLVARGLVSDDIFDQTYAELADPDFWDLSAAVFTAWGHAPGLARR